MEQTRPPGEAPPAPAPAPPRSAHPFYQNAFADLIAAEPGVAGRVLDVGCGAGFHSVLSFVPGRCARLDGLDPGDDVWRNPELTDRWQSTLEAAPLPEKAYDLAIAYNVVEHVADPVPFLRALHRTLRPGGAFWALTPHATHPFCMMSRAIEVLGFKAHAARRNPGVNHYPSYYRLNRRRHVVRAARGLGFEAPRVVTFPVYDWQKAYFPRAVRWAPQLYDFALGNRVRALHLIFAFRLQRSAE